MTARKELLPCPFCGEKRISLNEPGKGYRYGSINCPACLVVMPGEVRDRDELIRCWNGRELPDSAQNVPSSEALSHIDERLADLREANGIFEKSTRDQSRDILRNSREIRWLVDLRTMLISPTPVSSTNRAGLLDPGIDGPYNEPCEHKSVHDGPRVDLVYGTAPTQVCDCGAWRTMHHKPGLWQTTPLPSTDCLKGLNDYHDHHPLSSKDPRHE